MSDELESGLHLLRLAHERILFTDVASQLRKLLFRSSIRQERQNLGGDALLLLSQFVSSFRGPSSRHRGHMHRLRVT